MVIVITGPRGRNRWLVTVLLLRILRAADVLEKQDGRQTISVVSNRAGARDKYKKEGITTDLVPIHVNLFRFPHYHD